MTFVNGSKVIIIKTINRAKLGTVLTVLKYDPSVDRYSFNEVGYRLNEKYIQYYHEGLSNDQKYDGWVNAETAEAAMVFFNDASRLKYVKEKLFDLVYAAVQQAANMVRNISVNGEHDDICIRAILEQWLAERPLGSVPQDRHQAILSDIACHFDYKEASLVDQAQAIANHTQTIAGKLKPKPEEPKNTMKLETKHYLNDQELSTMTTEQRIALISQTEKHIDKLKEVKTDSKLVKAEIAKAEKFLVDANALFDAE